jgi:prepilin-type N-terminal cleavage/methylation domain-containing protein
LSIYPKNSGFTLIELLVVMVILGITSSLVAPDLFSIVKRSQAKTELEKIKAISELSIERSFFAASQIGILFKDNTVIFSQLNQPVGIGNKVLKTITSEFFTFEETQVVINKGNWEGSALVKLTKSPDNKLKTFFLLKTNDATKATTINKDNDEGMSSESEDSEK